MKLFIFFIIALLILAISFVVISQSSMTPEQKDFATTTASTPSFTSEAQASVSVNEVVLAPDVTAEVSGLSIWFKALIQDNRCPVDAQCIEAGAVTASITLGTDGKLETHNISSDEVPYEYMGYKVSIVAVSPDARSAVSIKPNDYKVTFKVE